MQFAKRHAFIDGSRDTTDFAAARGKYIFEQISDHQLVCRYENPEHLNPFPRIACSIVLERENAEDTSHRIPAILSGGMLVFGMMLIGASLYQKR